MNATAASTFELPLSDDAAWLLGTWSSLEVPFWGTVLLIKLVCERLGLGKKIQPTKTPPPELVAKTLRETLLNHALVHPVLIWFTYVPWLKVGGLPVSAVLPTVAQAAIQVAVWIFVNDTLFYFTHRLLHTRLLYKRFHKQHHEFHVSIAMAAEYATPFEAVVSNITPLLVGPVVWTRYVSPVREAPRPSSPRNRSIPIFSSAPTALAPAGASTHALALLRAPNLGDVRRPLRLRDAVPVRVPLLGRETPRLAPLGQQRQLWRLHSLLGVGHRRRSNPAWLIRVSIA
eukprot:4079470-Prymnesium_polylepis.1